MARLALQFPMSLAIYPDYEQAQRAVDYLSDHQFPVQNCMIVGTDLKQVERVTGRLTHGKVVMGGAASGMWFGALIGFLMVSFTPGGSWAMFLTALLLGAFFGIVWAWLGYSVARGRRDFTSVSQVVATRYEVLVEHAQLATAKELLSGAGGPERAGMFAASGGGMPGVGMPAGGTAGGWAPGGQPGEVQQQVPPPSGPGWPASGPFGGQHSRSGNQPGPTGSGHTGATAVPPIPPAGTPAESAPPAAPPGADAPYRTYGEAIDAQKRAQEQGETREE